MRKLIISLWGRYKIPIGIIGVVCLLLAGAKLFQYQGSSPSSDQPALPPSPTDHSAADPSSQAAPTSAPAEIGFSLEGCLPDQQLLPAGADDITSTGFNWINQLEIQPLPDITALSAARSIDEAGYGIELGESYALTATGDIYRWGNVGRRDQQSKGAFPVRVDGLPGKVTQLSGSFALLDTGDVVGLGTDGELAERKLEPLAGLSKISSISAFVGPYLYAVHRDGTVSFYNPYGQNGKPEITPVKGLKNIRAVYASPSRVYAEDKTGDMWWFPSYYEQHLPDPQPKKLQMPAGERVVRMDPGFQSEAAFYLLTDKDVWYSINHEGNMIPSPMPKGTIQVAGTTNRVYTLLKNGEVWVKELKPAEADPTQGKREPTFEPVRDMDHIQALSPGPYHILALTKEGQVLSLGSNMYGQLGRLPVYSEELVPFARWREVKDVVPTRQEAYVVLQGGELWSLGYNQTETPKLLMKGNVMKAAANYAAIWVLTQDGALIINRPRNSDQLQESSSSTCHVIKSTSPIRDISAYSSGILVALEHGQVHYIELDQQSGRMKSHQLVWTTTASHQPQVKVYGGTLPLILTDQGELYALNDGGREDPDGVWDMRRLESEGPIREVTVMDYLYFEGSGVIGYARGAENKVYSINASFINFNPIITETKVELTSLGERAERLSGGMHMLLSEERATEWLPFEYGRLETKLPQALQLKAVASYYYYEIEGYGFHYHLFIDQEGTFYWVGRSPFMRDEAPGIVGDRL